METKEISKRFITQEFDKFLNMTSITWTYPVLAIATPGIGLISLRLSQVKTPENPEIDLAHIYYEYDGRKWLSLDSGYIIINLDEVDNVRLTPKKINREVISSERVRETGAWIITKDELKKVCDAKAIAVRISGESKSFELEGKSILEFQFMCRGFYAYLFNDSSYDEWINSVIPSVTGSEKKSGDCFIATAAMGSCEHPVVVDLRMFRDIWLLKRNWGKKFTNWYYAHSPKVSRIIERSVLLRKLTYILVVKPLQLITRNLR